MLCAPPVYIPTTARHFQENRRRKSAASASLRPWGTAAAEWTAGRVTIQPEEGAQDTPFFADDSGPSSMGGAGAGPGTPRVKAARADEEFTHCPVCGEEFEQYWDEDEQEWLYRGTVWDEEEKVRRMDKHMPLGVLYVGAMEKRRKINSLHQVPAWFHICLYLIVC